jgi:type III secretory pathway component EscS
MEDYFSFSFLVLVLVSGVPLVVATLVGFVCAVIQTLFSIQEQATIFCVRLIAVGVLFMCFGSVGIELVTQCLKRSMYEIAEVRQRPEPR